MPPSVASCLSRAATAADGAIVEAGEGLVEQDQPRLVQQRALQGEPLPHAPRKPGHVVVGAFGESGALERRVHDLARIQAESSAKNVRFWRAVNSA
jgi:hypothetical protein